VTRQHAAITERARKVRKGKYASGRYAANGSMRLARAVWNFSKNELETAGLPELNPFRSGKLYHREQARENGMGTKDLPAWWVQLQKTPEPDSPRNASLHAALWLAPSGRAHRALGQS
jgi:hypothetical protein